MMRTITVAAAGVLLSATTACGEESTPQEQVAADVTCPASDAWAVTQMIGPVNAMTEDETGSFLLSCQYISEQGAVLDLTVEQAGSASEADQIARQHGDLPYETESNAEPGWYFSQDRADHEVWTSTSDAQGRVYALRVSVDGGGPLPRRVSAYDGRQTLEVLTTHDG